MLKLNRLIKILTFASLVILPLSSSAAEEQGKEDPNLEAIHRWLIAAQHPTGLVSSREGKEGICFVYDQALAVDAFLLLNDAERAKKVLNFFKQEYLSQQTKGHFIGFVDMYFSTGATGAIFRAVGPNAWLLNTINQYSYITGDLQFLALAEAIGEWIIGLQGIDGGVSGGFHPNLHWTSTEHNLDAYAALRNLYYFTRTPKYAQKAEEFKVWLEKVAWIPEEKRFGNGKNDFNFALDVSSWAVLALGPQYKETLRFAEANAQNKQTYIHKNIDVEGFDFGGPYLGTFYPDKDAVWFEGTGQMSVAYRIAGENEKADYFLKQLEQCLTPSSASPDALGLPYASNTGTPPYGGWQMTDTPLCLSSTAWLLFAKKNFNPLNLGGKLLVDEKELGWPVEGILAENHAAKQFVPLIDGFEGTIAQFLTSYPASGMETSQCIFHRSLEFNEKASGSQALRLLFIPRGITGIQGEFLKNEIYAFVLLKNEKLVIAKTSSQPEFAEEKKEILPEQMGGEPALRQPAQAVLRRKFTAPQNWSGKTRLAFSLWHDDSPNFFFVGMKDSEGRLWFSKEIPLEGGGWQQHSFDFSSDLRLLETGLGAAPFTGEKISEIWFGLRSGTPATESIVYLDDVQLL